MDFKHINSPEDFELLCEDLLRSMGYHIELGVARGPDRGRDILASFTHQDAMGFRMTKRYLIECKHHAQSEKSVKESEIGNVAGRMGTHNCERYLLITSTVASEKVLGILQGLQNTNPQYQGLCWNKGDLLRLLHEKSEVRDRYFPAHLGGYVYFPHLIVEKMRELLTKPGNFEELKRLLVENSQLLPSEYFMYGQYGFKKNIDVPNVGAIDCISARADTPGVRTCVYFFGSPYHSPFTNKGRPSAELLNRLALSQKLINTITRPLAAGHPLHPAIITGVEDAGMSRRFYEEREAIGLGAYGPMSVYLIFGQRSSRRTNHEINIENCLGEWRNQLDIMRSDLDHPPRDLKIDILSYDRMIKDKLSQ